MQQFDSSEAIASHAETVRLATEFKAAIALLEAVAADMNQKAARMAASASTGHEPRNRHERRKAAKLVRRTR